MTNIVRHLKLSAALLLSAAVAAANLAAQESSQQRQAEQGNRGRGIRDFLGLGAAPDPVAAERGQKLYAPSCAFCHGEKARGAEGPNLLRSPLVLHDEKGELIGPVLLQGRADKGMPRFPSLTEAQVYDIAQFLHLQIELAANRGIYKPLDVVTGDPKKGESYFNGAGRCNTCHSVTGDLAHIARKYPPDQLQNRFLWPASGGAGRARKVTVTLPSGETITGTLKRIDDFNVSLYDSTGSYRSWSRENTNIKVDIDDQLSAHRELLEKYSDDEIHNILAFLVTLK